MTKWITLLIIISLFLFSNLALAQTPDPFITQLSSLLQTIQNLANQINSLQNRPLLPITPTAPVALTSPAPTPVTTGSFFRRSGVSYFDQVRINQELRLQAYASSTATARAVSPAPEILTITPTTGKIGTKITITGRNFTKTGNLVNTGFGQLNLPSADGKTLTFTMTRPSSMPADFASQAGDYWRQNNIQASLPLSFYVKNANGQSARPGLFLLTFN